MKKIICLFLWSPFLCFSQFETDLIELKKTIHSNIKPENKIDAYAQLIEYTLESNAAESMVLITELRQLNTANSCINCEVMADFEEANLYKIKNDNVKATTYFEKAASKSLESKNYFMFQLSKSFKMHCLLQMNKFEETEFEINNYDALRKKLHIKTGLEEFYFIKGFLNYKKGLFNSSVENYLTVDKIITDEKLNKRKLRSTTLDRISMVYKELNNYDKAIEYNVKAIEQAKVMTDDYGVYIYTLNRGIIETDSKHYANGLPYLKVAEKYFRANKNQNYSDSCNLYLGITYYYLNQFPTSISYLQQANTSFEKAEDPTNSAKSLLYLSKNFLKTNKIEDAKNNILKAKYLMRTTPESILYLSILDVEIDFNKKINNFSEALDIVALKDSLTTLIHTKSNLNNLNEYEAKYQTEKKEQQIKLLSTQNELDKKQKYIYIGLLGLLVFISGIAFYGYRNKIKTARKLNELNNLKSRFFANISHEFRTPLTLIKSPVQSLQNQISDKNHRTKLNLIEVNSTRMLQLVDQLLELSKIDSGNLKLILKEGNVGSFLTAIVEPFEFQAQEKNIHFETSIQKTTENNSFDKDVVEKIVTNLLTNAFKYSPEHEKITFASSVINSKLKLIVANSGSDVIKENLPKFFERFYQKSDESQGVGIGLALVKELVELYKGTIETRLEAGRLSFIISLPLTISNRKAVVIPTKTNTYIIENQFANEAELPILLLVDDNAEIRMILKDIFKEQYTILEAQDGKEGLKIAQKEIPDCIISDVMMPKMNGFELTAAIKNNELTSFIPLLLLTAKTSDQAHLEGLKSTADAFLTKPFNNEIVAATVAQLIAERKKLHLRYSQELVLKPVDIVINSVEEKFIEKLQVILEKELSNPEFSSEDFAAAVGMSRMQLHRKLKSLLGVSATEFLRNERLKIAADLLQKGNGNISEIAYAVGFNDVSYFSKCFKELFSATPSDYLNSKNS